MKRKVKIIPPENLENLKLGPMKEKAAGVQGVVSALQHVQKEIGIFKGIPMLNQMNQKGGFDCPGCAWPDPDDHRSALGEYCENGAKAIAEEKTNKKVSPSFFHEHSVEELSYQTDYWLGKAGRITHPMYLAKDSSHYKEISWEEAFKIAAKHFKALSSPDEAVMYTSGRTSNEAAFMYQLFAKQLGTNNLPDCSNMCHESSGVGLTETLGIGKGSVTLEDLHMAEVIVVIGQNPGTNHPRMLSALEKCKKNGGQIVTINPLPETGLNTFVDPQSPSAVLTGGTQLTDLFLQVKINGDIALLKATMYLMLKKEKVNPGSVFDLNFIKERTAGFDEFIQELEELDFDQAIKESGVTEEAIRYFADMLAKNEKIICCWAMGLTQHENGVQNIREVVNLLLMKGAIAKPGAGTCPVRGHSNVQGDRTMGIYEKPAGPFLDKIDEHFGITSPREHGYDVVDAIKAMHDNKVKIFMSMGGNFISATPDSVYTGEAVMNCDLTIQVSTKLNRSHLVTGKEALIFPCLSRAEVDMQISGLQFQSVENSMGVVHSTQGTFKPASDFLLSEPTIVAALAMNVFGDNSPIDWQSMVENYDNVRNHIEAVIPGFENYNERVRIPEGFYLPNGARSGKFKTKNYKANFTINPMPNRKVKPSNLIMMTIRTHDQYNTTIYGMDDRYRGIYNERRVILMNPEDIHERHLKAEQTVHLTSIYNGQERIARNFQIVPFNIAKGCCATYFPEANVLVPIDSVAEKSNTPASKFIEVDVVTYLKYR